MKEKARWDFKKWSLVALTGFSDKKMTGRLVGTKQSGRINEVVVRRGSTVRGREF